MDHPDQAGGIIYQQSAMKQLQKRKEPHHEKEKHLSKPKFATAPIRLSTGFSQVF